MQTRPNAAHRPRVLIANSTLHIGGAEKVAANLAVHLDQFRFEVTACYLKQNGVVGEQMARDGVNLVPIPGLRSDDRADYFTSLKLLRLIRQRNIQILHTHDTSSFIDGAICKLLRPSLKFINTFHWGNYPVLPAGEERVERLFWRLADALVCVGHEQAAQVRKLYRIPESRIRVIWNGTDMPRPDVAAEVRDLLAGDGTPVLCSISTLIPQKGLEDLLEAAAIIRRAGKAFRLLLVGEGRLRETLEKRAAELDLNGTVFFLGWVKEASRKALPACDVFVQSSHWEAMSVVVIEAMAAGKAIVATTVGENGRVITDEVDGLLVPPKEPARLAAAMVRAIEDADLRARLGANARQKFARQFTTAHMIRNYEQLYSELLK
jgi:glycosyltransferase involved in cell wall biosynthesis